MKTNEALDDIKQDGTPLEDLENEVVEELLGNDEPEEEPEDSQPEDTKTKDDSPQDEDKKKTEKEKSVPFHEHPRWKEREVELKELREFKEKNADLPEQIEEIQKAQTKQAAQLPAWWVTLYGNDEVAQEGYIQQSAHEAELRASIKEEMREEQAEAQQKVTEDAKKWDTWVASEVETLKAEGNDFNKNELLKVATEMQPTDSDGNISLRKSLEILNLQKAAKGDDTKSKDRKKVASLTNSNNRGDDSGDAKKTLSSQDLRGKSMQTLMHGNE